MRLNLNIADELVEKIDERCKQLYINRSAYINMATARQIEMDTIMLNMPEMISVLNSLAGAGSVGLSSVDVDFDND